MAEREVENRSITPERLRSALDAIVARTSRTLRELGSTEFPLVADPESGEWETTDDGNWCGGHWIGLLWLAAEHTDDETNGATFENAARAYTELLDEGILDTMWGGSNFHVAGFRAYDYSGDRSLYGLGLKGADSMVSLFHHRARQIPVGEYTVAGPQDEFDFGVGNEEGPSGTRVGSSDSIYTALPALWRAYRETNDPRFRDVAISHADRHIDWHVREDGSTWNRTVFDPETGESVRNYNALAHSDDTCWARGQGWIIAGYALAYRETGAERYLDTLETVVGYYLRNSPDDLVPYWDFEAPGIPQTNRDTSAAGLAAYGLCRLDQAGEHERRVASLRETGDAILDSLLEDYLVTDRDSTQYGMVLHGCYDKPGDYATDNELVWTNYYLAYTLHELLKDSS